MMHQVTEQPLACLGCSREFLVVLACPRLRAMVQHHPPTNAILDATKYKDIVPSLRTNPDSLFCPVNSVLT